MEKKAYKRCVMGLWDTSIPDITFDENGVSNYYKMFEKLEQEFPRGDIGSKKWDAVLENIKKKGKNNKHDCIIGLSGGTDSSYLLHWAVKKWGLRPLAVYLDNGWSSDVAVTNIKKLTDALNVPLYTYVIDYEEVKIALRSWLKASLPWPDQPTDIAITSSLYMTAAKEKIKYILTGRDFRSEGKQPLEWTYGDSKMLKYLTNYFENYDLKNFPYFSLWKLGYYSLIIGIKQYRPLYYLDYKKNNARLELTKKYAWQYYGGHHHENIFTKFCIGYWEYKKFNSDKRIISYSAQVISGEITRNEAIKIIKESPLNNDAVKELKNLVIKKLDLTDSEFEKIWNSSNKSFHDYPSYYPFLSKYRLRIAKIIKYFMPMKPQFLIVNEN